MLNGKIIKDSFLLEQFIPALRQIALPITANVKKSQSQNQTNKAILKHKVIMPHIEFMTFQLLWHQLFKLYQFCLFESSMNNFYIAYI